jgi:hypothetical protein
MCYSLATVIPMYEKIMKLLKYNLFPIVLHLDNIIGPIGAHLSTSLGHRSQMTVQNVPKNEKNDLFQCFKKMTIGANQSQCLILTYLIEVNEAYKMSYYDLLFLL